MNYPLISEYIDAILNAEDNFATLTNLRPVLTDEGRPVMNSGNFAVVFKMQDVVTDKLHAVKCFTRYDANRENSYKLINDFLKHEDSEYLVSFEYMDEELFVDSKQTRCVDFPVLLMDWVEGVPLDVYFDTQTETWKKKDLTNNFHKFACWLLREPFAHGDLKPDNILVQEDGSLRIIDYDGMYVPAMYGQCARENGTPMYVAPTRSMDSFDEHIDDYAIIKILISLKYLETKHICFEDVSLKNGLEFIRQFDDCISDIRIAPLLSAFIFANAFGFIDKHTVTSLLANRDCFDYTIEHELLEKANGGDINSVYSLGELYKKGQFVPKDEGKALKWFYIASQLGKVDATCGICSSLYAFDIPFTSIIGV